MNQWLQVDLGKITPVTHVATRTQGRNTWSPAQIVTKYKLQFSDDGASFLFYERKGESTDAVNRNIITRYPFMIFMFFAGWEVRIVKNCDLGHSFSDPP